MTLDQYLSLPGAPTAADFGEKCGLSAVSISRIRKGEQNFTRDVMLRIIEASGNVITADGLLRKIAA
jgi:hypothetical protein